MGWPLDLECSPYFCFCFCFHSFLIPYRDGTFVGHACFQLSPKGLWLRCLTFSEIPSSFFFIRY